MGGGLETEERVKMGQEGVEWARKRKMIEDSKGDECDKWKKEWRKCGNPGIEKA